MKVEYEILPDLYRERLMELFTPKYLCIKLRDLIKSAGYGVHLDNRESYPPGFKYNDWEMSGVPFRVEVGAREAEEETELSCLGYPQDDHGEGKCVVCSLPGKPAYFSRTY